jgi:hypothetical protein
MKNTQDRLKVMREVALRADDMQAKARELGGNAALGLTRQRRAQVTGLEGIANSALKTSDVLDYIKLRIARERRGEWTYGNWGPDLLQYLGPTLGERRTDICSRLGLDAAGIDGLEVHLMLVREFVRQFSAEYEYQCRLHELPSQAQQRGGR